MKTRRVRIGEVTPGMTLAESIANNIGVSLMPAGIRLTPMFINKLEKWNIASILVTSDEDDEDREDDGERDGGETAPVAAGPVGTGADAAREQEFRMFVIDRVGTWFANVRDNPLMMQLRAIAIRRMLADGPDGHLVSLRGDSSSGGEKDA